MLMSNSLNVIGECNEISICVSCIISFQHITLNQQVTVVQKQELILILNSYCNLSSTIKLCTSNRLIFLVFKGGTALLAASSIPPIAAFAAVVNMAFVAYRARSDAFVLTIPDPPYLYLLIA